MKPQAECYACFLRQTLIAARLAKATGAERQDVQRRTMRTLLAEGGRHNPPHIATLLFRQTYRQLGCRDPYLGLKREYNGKVKALLPGLEKRLKASADPFTLAVRLALAGNIIDFGILESVDLGATLRTVLALRLPAAKLAQFRRRVRTARTILHLADNAGEIGFDALLIREIRRMNPGATVFLAVKRSPVINDATRADARFFGLERLARLIDTGPAWVGTHLAGASPSFRKLFAEADLVISKGQANWESLEELRDPRITFLLQAKCPVVARLLRVPLGRAIIV